MALQAIRKKIQSSQLLSQEKTFAKYLKMIFAENVFVNLCTVPTSAVCNCLKRIIAEKTFTNFPTNTVLFIYLKIDFLGENFENRHRNVKFA